MTRMLHLTEKSSVEHVIVNKNRKHRQLINLCQFTNRHQGYIFLFLNKAISCGGINEKYLQKIQISHSSPGDKKSQQSDSIKSGIKYQMEKQKQKQSRTGGAAFGFNVSTLLENCVPSAASANKKPTTLS